METYKVFKRAAEVFSRGNAHALRWCFKYSPNLGGRPFWLVQKGKADKVLDLLNKIDYGIF
jgi:uncharacterized protein (DUF2384 family)